MAFQQIHGTLIPALSNKMSEGVDDRVSGPWQTFEESKVSSIDRSSVRRANSTIQVCTDVPLSIMAMMEASTDELCRIPASNTDGLDGAVDRCTVALLQEVPNNLIQRLWKALVHADRRQGFDDAMTLDSVLDHLGQFFRLTQGFPEHAMTDVGTGQGPACGFGHRREVVPTHIPVSPRVQRWTNHCASRPALYMASMA